ncbi:MAG: hypothetical protein AB2604_10665 [Candidatus Thiodiazotropha taylori]
MNTIIRCLMTFLLLGSLFIQPAFADRLELQWSNATARANGDVFDPEVELASIEIGCGTSLVGPFDAFQASVVNEAGSAAPTDFTTDVAPAGLRGCVAYSVDLNGLVSAPSNIGEVAYLSPIEAIRDLGQRCYGSCPGVVNFNFTIGGSPQ